MLTVNEALSLLNISKDTTLDEKIISQAYRETMLKNHPDKALSNFLNDYPNATEQDKIEVARDAGEKTQLINEAREVLLNSLKVTKQSKGTTDASGGVREYVSPFDVLQAKTHALLSQYPATEVLASVRDELNKFLSEPDDLSFYLTYNAPVNIRIFMNFCKKSQDKILQAFNTRAEVIFKVLNKCRYDGFGKYYPLFARALIRLPDGPTSELEAQANDIIINVYNKEILVGLRKEVNDHYQTLGIPAPEIPEGLTPQKEAELIKDDIKIAKQIPQYLNDLSELLYITDFYKRVTSKQLSLLLDKYPSLEVNKVPSENSAFTSPLLEIPLFNTLYNDCNGDVIETLLLRGANIDQIITSKNYERDPATGKSTEKVSYVTPLSLGLSQENREEYTRIILSHHTSFDYLNEPARQLIKDILSVGLSNTEAESADVLTFKASQRACLALLIDKALSFTSAHENSLSFLHLLKDLAVQWLPDRVVELENKCSNPEKAVMTSVSVQDLKDEVTLSMPKQVAVPVDPNLRNQVLDSIQFNKRLGQISNKITQWEKNKTKFKTAITAADSIIVDLNHAKKTFLTDGNLASFKSNCLTAIQTRSQGPLKQHRGILKNVLSNLVASLLTLGIVNIVRHFALNKSAFFTTKTDSTKKLERLEAKIEELPDGKPKHVNKSAKN